MRPVHVGVGHDDDLVVAELLEVESPLPFPVADAGANGGDHRADFGVLQHLVQPGFLHVDEFTPDGQNCLELAVAPLLGGAAGRVTLDNIDFGVGRIAIRAIGQLPGQPAARQCALAHGVARFASGFARPGRHQRFVHAALGHRWIGIEITHQSLVNDGGNDAVDFRVHEFDFGLRFETRIRQLQAQHADQPLANVIARNGGIFFLQQIAGLRVLVDRPGESAPKAGHVRAPVWVRNRVGKAKNLIGVTVVVLHHAIDKHLVLLTVDRDGFGVNDLFILPQLLHELLDPFLVKKSFGLIFQPLVGQKDLHARVEESQFPETIGQDLELELGGDRENGGVRLESDQGPGAVRLADDLELLRRLPSLKSHVVNIPVPGYFHLEPIRKSVNTLGSHPVQPARIFVCALAKLAARVQVRQHQFNRRHVEFWMHIHGDTASVIPDGARAIHMDSHLDAMAKPGQMFIDGIVQHLENAMMQPALIRVADVHARTFSDRLQPFEFIDLRGIVFVSHIRRGGDNCLFHQFRFVLHKKGKTTA